MFEMIGAIVLALTGEALKLVSVEFICRLIVQFLMQVFTKE